MIKQFTSSVLQSFPAFKGKFRIARFLINVFGWRDEHLEVKSKKNRVVYSLPNLNENIAVEIFTNGEYEPDIIDLLSKLMLVLDGAFVDVGANIGSITMPLAKQNKERSFLLVEASPWIFNVLRKNLENNFLSNAKALNVCMSDQKSDAVKFFAPKGKFGKGSMKEVFTNEFELVESITLDELIKNEGAAKIALIKVDVEGFEQQVFTGGRDLLSASNAPLIIFEAVNWAEKLAGNKVSGAQRTLKEYGYHLYEINDEGKLKSMATEVDSPFCMLVAIKEFHIPLLKKINVLD
jgi:FkbM family methyltransferase